jgi:membrane associated rhomboid family serine protease
MTDNNKFRGFNILSTNNNEFRVGGFKILPPVVKNLLIINGLFFLATLAFDKINLVDLNDILGLHFITAQKFHFYQFVTYMFMHGNVPHIFFNMFALWMFGSALENCWGTKRFLLYYFITGIGAGLMQEMVCAIRLYELAAQMDSTMIQLVKEQGLSLLQQSQNYVNLLMQEYNSVLNSNTVGASGAVYGLLLAFGMMFPNSLIYIYFLFPMKAKWFVVLYGVLELINGIVGSNSGIAHFAHLGGMIFGFFLILHWRNKNIRKRKRMQQQYSNLQYFNQNHT